MHHIDATTRLILLLLHWYLDLFEVFESHRLIIFHAWFLVSLFDLPRQPVRPSRVDFSKLLLTFLCGFECFSEPFDACRAMRSSRFAPTIVSGVDALRTPGSASVPEQIRLPDCYVLWGSGSVFAALHLREYLTFKELFVGRRTSVDPTSLHVHRDSLQCWRIPPNVSFYALECPGGFDTGTVPVVVLVGAS